MDSALEQQPARRGRNPEKEKEIETEVLQSYQKIKWTHGYDQDHWFCDLRNVFKPPRAVSGSLQEAGASMEGNLGHGVLPSTVKSRSVRC